ncbi:MAG: 1-acyl-sn-glycerol-3-phosphate acyltransferase [Planctomycetota bacterium]
MIPHPRRLIPHLASCFAGAAVDGVFRLSAATALTMAAVGAGSSIDGEGEATRSNTIAMLWFTLPFLIFAPLAGSLGDRLPKHVLMRWVRFLDLPILALGGFGLWLGDPKLFIGALVLLGTASAFFAPAKLSCVPELVDEATLAVANAWVQGVTIVAIVLGGALVILSDPKVVDLGMHPAMVVTLVCSIIAVIGLIGAWMLPPLPAQNPSAPLRPFAYISQAKVLFERPGLAIPAFSLAGFWGLGTAVSCLFSPMAKCGWDLDASGPAIFGLCLSAGIILGAGLAPRLMSVSMPAGLPIAGALLAGLSLVGAGWIGAGVLQHPEPWVDMKGFPPGSLIQFSIMLAIAGIGAGLWDVPMNVLLQQRSDPQSRNRVMAAMGIATAMGMVLATICSNQLSAWLGLSAAQIILLWGGIAASLALGGIWLYRRQFVGWAGSLVLKLLFKVEVQGAEHLPTTGGCVIIANHLSLADGILLSAALPRRAKFMVYRWFCDLPVIGWGLRAWGVIPVDGKGGARALMAAVQSATDEAAAGNVVGLFPEGKMTRSGMLDTFKPGIERIAQRANVPIVPCAIEGLWRTPYSYAERKHW